MLAKGLREQTYAVDIAADGEDALLIILKLVELQPAFSLPVNCPDVGTG